MAEMKTDASALSAEAANFDRIASELTTVINGVEHTGGELAGHWKGSAGSAAQQALGRFHEAGQAQIKALADIHEKISQAGIQYSRTSDEQTSALQSQASNMGF
jgi:WXG100 family type VII secretion target